MDGTLAGELLVLPGQSSSSFPGPVNSILSKSIVAGTLHVSGYYLNKNLFFKKLNRLSKKIKVSSKKYYGWFLF